MSRQDVEVVVRVVREFIATHALPGPELVAPDFVWDTSGFRGWPGVAEYRGPDGFERFFGQWIAPYEECDMELEDLVHAGGSRVVTTLRQRGRPKRSRCRVDLRFGIVTTVVDGRIRRMELFSAPEEALMVVGIRESPVTPGGPVT